MAIYTCLDMIGDCRQNKAEGWVYLITWYTAVLRRILAHYYPDRASDAGLLGRVLGALRDPSSVLFAAPGPATEREFVAELRQAILAAVEEDRSSAAAQVSLDFATVGEALQPLTVVEKQVAWLETMAYSVDDAAKLMNLDPTTISSVWDRTGDLLRSKIDCWSRGLIAENGAALGRAAAAASGDHCLPAKAHLDAIDGRITWARKQDAERHLAECWHCIDCFCRIREADAALRGLKPLTAAEAEPFRVLLGIPSQKRSLWKRVAQGFSLC